MKQHPIESIRWCECSQPWVPAYGLYGTTEETRCPACILREMLADTRHERDAALKARDWVPVAEYPVPEIPDELPEDFEWPTALVYASIGGRHDDDPGTPLNTWSVEIGWHDGKSWLVRSCRVPVTHVMPLPKPPKAAL